MLNNYIKIAFRNLWRFRRFSLISVLSLALSLFVLLLLALLLFDQWKIDRHHPDADRIYRVLINHFGSDYIGIPAPLGPSLQNNYPGIEVTSRLRSANGAAASQGNRLSYRGYYAESDFFEMFAWTILDGVQADVFNEPRCFYRKTGQKSFSEVPIRSVRF